MNFLGNYAIINSNILEKISIFMDDQTQNNNDFSSGFLIKDKQGNIKKVKDDLIDDYSADNKAGEDFVSIRNLQQPSVPPIQNKNQAHKSNPQPSPAVTSQASFVGDPDEEEEIRNHQAELNKILATAQTSKAISYDELIKELIDKYALKFENEILTKRFQKVIESRIKEIRNSIETAEVLHRPSKVGGLEMTEDQANNIVKYVDEHKKNLIKDIEMSDVKKNAPTPIKKSEAVIPVSLSAAPPAFIPMPNQPKPAEKIPEKKESRPDLDMIENQDSVTAQAESKSAQEKIAENIKIGNLYNKTPSDEMAKMSINRRQDQQRPQVVDIRQPASVVGPVEELMQIDLKEFRRLGNNPAESADKILEKIYLLEEESWEMRMDGIVAWQASPLHKLYVDIGQDSLKQNKTVMEIITARENSSEPSIHVQEFLAINDLNNKLVI